MTGPILLTAGQVADLLSISSSKVYRMMRDGELPTIRLGRNVRVPQNQLADWVSARTEVAA